MSNTKPKCAGCTNIRGGRCFECYYAVVSERSQANTKVRELEEANTELEADIQRLREILALRRDRT